jgi:hypothetical protein
MYIYIVILFRVNILGTKRSQKVYINTICRNFTARSSDRTFFITRKEGIEHADRRLLLVLPSGERLTFVPYSRSGKFRVS